MLRPYLPAFSALVVLGCQPPAAPASSAPPTQTAQPAAAKTEAAPESAKATSVHGGQAAPAAPRVMTTNRPADPNRIPNDAIHAAYQKTGAHAGGRLPGGHPAIDRAAPHAPFAPKVAAGETGVDLPLPLQGPGSVDELRRRGKSIVDAAARARVEKAFRLTFTLERESRDPAKAAELLEPLVNDPIAGATASRVLGYVAVSRGFDFAGAMKHYGEAVRKDPDYGEAHYALASMHVRGDKSVGRSHFERARALGVPDTRGIARFYPGVAKSAAKQPVDAPK